MTDLMGLDNDDFFIISELMMREGEPLTAKDFKGLSNPSAHLKKMEILGLIKQAKWDYTGKYYKPVKTKLLKAGIITKEKKGYRIYLGVHKHPFTLGLDSPTEKGFASLFRGLDRIKKTDWELWKGLVRMISDGMYHYFVKTEEGFLTEEQSIAEKKRRTEEQKKELKEGGII